MPKTPLWKLGQRAAQFFALFSRSDANDAALVEVYAWRLLSFISCVNDLWGWNFVTTATGVVLDYLYAHYQQQQYMKSIQVNNNVVIINNTPTSPIAAQLPSNSPLSRKGHHVSEVHSPFAAANTNNGSILPQNLPLWRKPPGNPSSQGIAMAKAVIPNLLQAWSLTAVSTNNSNGNAAIIEQYAKMSACLLLFWGDWYKTLATIFVFVVIFERGSLSYLGQYATTAAPYSDSGFTLLSWQPILFAFIWTVMYQFTIYDTSSTLSLSSRIYHVFTMGEFLLVSCWLSIVLVEAISLTLTTNADTLLTPDAVALIGVASCLSACFIDQQFFMPHQGRTAQSPMFTSVNHWPNQLSQLMSMFSTRAQYKRLILRVLFLVCFPLLSIDVMLFWKSSYQSAVTNKIHASDGFVAYIVILFVPDCILWIWDFLLKNDKKVVEAALLAVKATELEMLDDGDDTAPVDAPNGPMDLSRFYWILHCVVVLTLMLPVAPYLCNHLPIVITRKWFHLMALIMFVPIVWNDPDFISLAYAVAVCALMVVECLRLEIPVILQFYQNYLDIANKDEQANAYVVSHITLLVGCAAPLWMSRILLSNDDGEAFGANLTIWNRLLELWGILSIGVADAAAAIIGSKYGRISWGHRRTLEGSVAFAASLSLACILVIRATEAATVARLSISSSLWILPSIVIFCTVLEAYTVQLDNLVLPLAGSCVVLLCMLATLQYETEVVSSFSTTNVVDTVINLPVVDAGMNESVVNTTALTAEVLEDILTT